MIELTVYGTPGPQGSKRFVGTKSGHGVMIESSPKVKLWREAVKWAFVEKYGDLPRPVLSGAVSLDIIFTLARPKSVRGRYARPSTRPDLSKLVRSTEDALTEVGAWEDDARVVSIGAHKVYVGWPQGMKSPGAEISIAEVAKW